ncbi:hypothetical protein EUX98_g9162 [Antrodiella citrinella]|uniref:Uncharacterized protein n=1 Tax=Antrodiella citrinella TaxID=2447956 RepID=A0A4S4LZ70_9APHY|nr:hypothetical protein EUX98_g9162 [Antrodiella citrinella]
MHVAQVPVRETPAKIPKPIGESGRPGRMGYTLKKALNWPGRRYTDVMKTVKTIVVRDMKCVSYTRQPLSVLKRLRDEVLAKHPFLAEYEDLWLIDDSTRATLKIHITTCKIAENRKISHECRDELAALRAEEDENGDGHEV